MSTKTILIIEDSVSSIAGYMQILEVLNMDVITMVAPTFEKARGILRAEQVDLIIMDLVLPDVLGTDVLEELRRRNPHVPILLVTGHPEDLDRQKAERFRVAGFFIKPFRVEAFGEAIHSSLGSPDKQSTGPGVEMVI